MKNIDLNKLSKDELINIIIRETSLNKTLSTEIELKKLTIETLSDKVLDKEKELKENKLTIESLSDKVLDKEKELEENKIIIDNLTNKIISLEAENRKINAEKDALIKEIEKKGFQVSVQQKEIFGSKSEQKEYLNIDDSFIFNEVEAETSLDVEEEIKSAQKKDKKKVGRKKDTQNYAGLINVETKEEIIDCTETICPNCGSILEEIDDEIITKLICIPASYIKYIYRFKRRQCPKCGNISKADDIDIFGKSLLSNSLASHLTVEKYVKGVPLYRLESILDKQGISLSRQLQANYLINVASELYPIYEKMTSDLINNKYKVIHADETTLKVIKNKENKKTSYMWLYGTSDYDPKRILIYDYKLNRSGKNPSEFLKDYSGYLVCDGYSGYDNISNVILARCFFHARKKFAEILKSDKTKIGAKSISGHVVNILDKAFYLEEKYRENNLSPIEIQIRRKEEIKPIIDEFFKFIKKIHPSSVYPIKNAIEYSLKYEKDLYTFIDYGYIPMTNNLAERGVKPFVINRKNFLFSYTEKGAIASAILMSITQTAKNNLLQIDKYIEYVLSKLQTTKQSEIESLLPYSDKLPDEIKIKIE